MENKIKIDDNEEVTQLRATNKTLEAIAKELKGVDHYENFAVVVQSIGRLSKELQLKLSDVEKAVKRELPAPNISVKAPEVKVDVPKVDLSGVENLLLRRLPVLIKQITDAIPETPETDFSRLEELLNKLLMTTAEVRDRKFPVPQMPTTLKVTNPDGSNVASPLVGAPLVGQAKIAVTGTAVQLNGTTKQTLSNGVIITAGASNAASIELGLFNVTNTTDGTGKGYILVAGASVSFGVISPNVIWINGTAGDLVSWAGS